MGKKYLCHKPVAPDKVLKRCRRSEEEINKFYAVQPKYDGVHIIMRVEGLHPDAVKVFTRTGEPVTSMAHVVEALVAFPGIRPGVYDGEGWQGNRRQAKINGDVMRNAPSPDLKFVIFDYLTLEEFDVGYSPLGYEKRVSRLPEPFFRIDAEKSPLFPAVCEGTLEELEMTAQEAAQQYVDLGGYDGVILRDPCGVWQLEGEGRGGEVLKIKPGMDPVVARVIGYEPGKGKHAGKIGTLVVSVNGKSQGAGTGLKDSERDIASFGANWMGKLVELKALGWTEDGFLREPVLKGVRHDVLEPDV